MVLGAMRRMVRQAAYRHIRELLESMGTTVTALKQARGLAIQVRQRERNSMLPGHHSRTRAGCTCNDVSPIFDVV